MRHLLVLAGIAALWSNLALAAEETISAPAEPANTQTADAETFSPTESEETVEPLDHEEFDELDLTIEPQEEIYSEASSQIRLPDCNDKLLAELVLGKIADYQQEHEASNLLEKRRQTLLLKNLNKFTEIPVVGFTSRQNFTVANNLLMTKINNGLDDQEIRLCKNQGLGNAGEIYLLIYPDINQIRVNILNFAQTSNAENAFFVVYP